MKQNKGLRGQTSGKLPYSGAFLPLPLRQRCAKKPVPGVKKQLLTLTETTKGPLRKNGDKSDWSETFWPEYIRNAAFRDPLVFFLLLRQ